METVTPTNPDVVSELDIVLNTMANMDAQSRWSFIIDSIKEFAPKLLTAVLVLVIGIILVRMVLKFARKILTKSKLDPSLHSFLLSILSVTFYIILGITVLATLVPSAVASLITLLGMFGLAISLAVKDSLANLAGGMSVLFTKPFGLEDYVKIGGNEGTIEEIRLNYTVMRTFDNKVIHIPNGDVAKAEIINFTGKPTRRLDIDFSIGYHDDFDLAKQIIRQTLADNPLALTDPDPTVRMVAHASSAILIGCRVWVNTPDYWTLKFDLLEEVKRRFDAAGITIPYSQMDVRIVQTHN